MPSVRSKRHHRRRISRAASVRPSRYSIYQLLSFVIVVAVSVPFVSFYLQSRIEYEVGMLEIQGFDYAGPSKSLVQSFKAKSAATQPPSPQLGSSTNEMSPQHERSTESGGTDAAKPAELPRSTRQEMTESEKDKARNKTQPLLSKRSMFRKQLFDELRQRKNMSVTPYEPTMDDLRRHDTVEFYKFCAAHNKPGRRFSPLVDKHAVKAWVKSITPELHFAMEYAHATKDNVTALTTDFLQRLPVKRFVLKAAHTCGSVTSISVSDDTVKCIKRPCLERKETLHGYEDLGDYVQRVCRWQFAQNYGKKFNEHQYDHIPRRCILEEQLDIASLYNYMVHVFHGRPAVIMMYHHVDGDVGIPVRYMRTPTQWKEILVPPRDGVVKLPTTDFGPRPEFMDNMLDMAQRLAKAAEDYVGKVPYVRVDFFVYRSSTDGQSAPLRVSFAELTFTHNNCNSFFNKRNRWADKFYGFIGQHPELDIKGEAILKLVEKAVNK